MKARSVAATLAIYLALEVLCGAITALCLHAWQFSKETAGWSMPALYAYVWQFIISAALIQSGRGSLVSNFAKSLLAVLTSAGIMMLTSYLLFRDMHRVEFQGADYVGAFMIYALTIPGQLVVAIAGPLLLAFRNARTGSATLDSSLAEYEKGK
jgi:hypothetical protein